MKCIQCKINEVEFGDTCQDCCQHEFDPDEGFHCLNCGLDGSEDVLAAAYDRYKDLKKYGH